MTDDPVRHKALTSWRDQLERVDQGIFLVRPGGAPPPRRVTYQGVSYTRFMDYILVPGELEDISHEQLLAINRLRLTLLERGYDNSTNSVVKSALKHFLLARAPGRVLEWGCGVDPVISRLPASVRIGVDADNSAVQTQRHAGLTCYLPNDPALLAYKGSIDILVAVFVLHFPLSAVDIDIMAHLLEPIHGFAVANVYRRPSASRNALRNSFRDAGLAIITRPDPLQLCSNHELWVLTHADSWLDTGLVLDDVERAFKRSKTNPELPAP